LTKLVASCRRNRERRGISGLSRVAAIVLSIAMAAQGLAQNPPQSSQTSKPAGKEAAAQQTGGRTAPGSSIGDKNSSKKPAGQSDGKDDTSAVKPASAGEQSASGTALRLGPLAPATPPTDLPKNRPAIGLALGGGGALGLSEIGTLQWFEEHRIPVDVIAGTSMGSILAALYATGHTPEQMSHIMTEESVTNVFRIEQAYSARSFRRREDSRDIPNAITVGLKHGAAFRNSLLTDTGLNELLDKEFLSYNDQTDFNTLPIPFRCQATDLTAAKTVTFSRGSLQDAVRASASIPGIFKPFELDGHEFVDGAILDNLPTQDVKAMNADVILAVSLPLEPVQKGDLNSILGVLARAFSVGIENNEQRARKLADVVITPDITGFTANDYLKTDQLALRGYAAAEANKAALMKYSLSPAEWEQYLAQRQSRVRGPVGTVLMVKVTAPSDSVKQAVLRTFAPVVDKPVDTEEVEGMLAQVRSDGRYNADYTVGYDTGSRRPILLVTVNNKNTGPPFLDIGFNIAAQTGGVTRATVNTILLDQDLGGYGSELRTKFDFGYDTLVESEYYRKLTWSGLFAAPRLNYDRTPYYIYNGNTRVSDRLAQFAGGGADVGWSNGRDRELRVGWQAENVRWTLTTGTNDGLSDYNGDAQTVRGQFIYDSQDRALVPGYGIRSVSRAGYLYATPGSPSTPQFFQRIDLAHTFSAKNVVLAGIEGATMLNSNVAQPFRYTLGGPLRLSASAIDQYRGTDYFLITPGYLREIKSLPAPFGNSLFFGAAYELGQMRSPNGPTITQQDVFFGLVAESPVGVISIGPAFGTSGERKLVFTIGKLF
jgi:NTE family protein